EVLVGHAIEGEAGVRDAAAEIVRLGARWVVMKGGHRAGSELVDILHDGDRFWDFRSPRIDTTRTHGTGCTLAAVTAARLARGDAATAGRLIDEAGAALRAAVAALAEHPDILHAGFVHDAAKEYAEARLVRALVDGGTPPTARELGVEPVTYLHGLAESVGEL